MDALVAQRPPELFLQNPVGAVQDEIHDLDWRVDNAQPVGVLLQRRGEELLV